MIKKADAVSRLTNEEKAELFLWEMKIDDALALYAGAACVVNCQGLPKRVRERLIAKYQQEGSWHVEYRAFDEQRTHPSLIFT